MSKHTLLPIIVSLLALAFIDPFMYWMPSNATWILLGGLFLATSVYAFFILTENANDEREVIIRAFADRVSSLIGMSLLVLVIGCQTFRSESVSTEIVVILVVMIISKFIAHWYAVNKM
ncbi:hypothetical protein KC850_04045 [Candidatus Kaiserbacteria bacterium]|nr:hypothetical protein [Candidatus Kaiserbacteria bacterium]MCB9817861.1 hypothetical protein [Candidatus Nomurabacteria bacterium]